MSEGYCS